MAHIEAEDEEEDEPDSSIQLRDRRQAQMDAVARGQRNEANELRLIGQGVNSKMTFGDDFRVSSEEVHYMPGKTEESRR